MYFSGFWENIATFLAVLEILRLQIAIHTNQTLLYITNIGSLNPTWDNLPQSLAKKFLHLLHLMPDDNFKKLPKFGQIKFCNR